MEGIRSNVAVQTQQSNKGKKALKHAVNAGIVVGGSTAIARGASHLSHDYDWANSTKFGSTNLRFTRKMAKLQARIANFAEALFPEGSKVSEALKKYVGDGYLTGGAKRMMSEYKGKLAIWGVATSAILTLLSAGIYKAGKINGEN